MTSQEFWTLSNKTKLIHQSGRVGSVEFSSETQATVVWDDGRRESVKTGGGDDTVPPEEGQPTLAWYSSVDPLEADRRGNIQGVGFESNFYAGSFRKPRRVIPELKTGDR